MNILYIGFFSLPDLDAAANRVMNNAKGLVAAGHKVMFIDEQRAYPYDDIIFSKHFVADFEAWTMKRPVSFRGFLKKMLSSSEIIKVIEYLETVDVVIAYNYPSVALLKLRRYCKKRGIKIVADCTEWYSGKEYRFPLSLFSSLDSLLRMRFIHKLMDGLVCISSYLCDYYRNQKNVLFVPPLIDYSENKWNQEKYGWNSEQLHLVYAGNPGKSKENMLPILNAIDKSKHKDRIVFRIIGITEEQFKEVYDGCELLLNSLKNNLCFMGRLPHLETLRLVQSSDYMIFMREVNRVSTAGFSTKYVEAITCSTPVITTDTGDLKKYTNELQRGYIVNNGDELNSLFDLDMECLKKGAILSDNRDIFDYRKYIDSFAMWIKKL